MDGWDTLRKRVLNRRIIVFLILALILGYYNIWAKIPTSITFVLELLFTIVITILAASVILRFTSKKVFTLFEDEVEIEQRIFLSKLYILLIYLLAFAIILWKLGVSVSNLALYAGLVTTGIAFAIRDIIFSIFAWAIILSKRPFRLGESIIIDTTEGQVHRIGMFFLTLLTPSKQKVKVPTKIFLEKVTIVNPPGLHSKKLLFELKKKPKSLDPLLTVLQAPLVESSSIQFGSSGGKPVLTIEYTAKTTQLQNVSEKVYSVFKKYI